MDAEHLSDVSDLLAFSPRGDGLPLLVVRDAEVVGASLCGCRSPTGFAGSVDRR
jgi:hypothetical protein